MVIKRVCPIAPLSLSIYRYLLSSRIKQNKYKITSFYWRILTHGMAPAPSSVWCACLVTLQNFGKWNHSAIIQFFMSVGPSNRIVKLSCQERKQSIPCLIIIVA